MKLELRRYGGLVILFVLASLNIYAQNIKISGKITGDNGAPLPGATVLVKGTSDGTVADADGLYQLSADRNSILVFSFVGFDNQEINLNGRSTLDVQMNTNSALDEVIVIGYGQRKLKDVTGSVASIGAKDISKTITLSPELTMQGRIAGVFVSTPGGSPTARPQVRIRGVSTFGDANPLYVVDGVPLYEQYSGLDGVAGNRQADIRGTVNILSLINPNDIESISVLKDASAAAVYGVRAANGVILITTKKGQIGKPKVELSASTGFQNAIGRFDVLNTQDYVSFYRDAFANNPDALKLDSYKSLDTVPTGKFYDWQKYGLNKNALIRDISARVSGGNESTTYYISAGYAYQDATFKGNDLARYSIATNITTKISKFVSTGFTYRFTYGKANDAAFSTGQPYNAQVLASNAPWQPILDPNDPFGYAPVARVTFKNNANYDPDKLSSGPPKEIDKTTLLWGPNTRSNQFASQELNPVTYDFYRNLGTAFLQLTPLPGLSVKGTLSADLTYNWRRGFNDIRTYVYNQTPGNPYAVGDGTSDGEINERHSRNVNYVKEVSVEYAKNFGQHKLNVLLNRMDQTLQYHYITAGTTQTNFADGQFRTVQEGPNRWSSAGAYRDQYALVGYLGRVSYNYASKYYLDATVRRDGSSRFAPENRWGVFPSVAAAWRISAEKFLKKAKFIDDLKIRVGYGQLGNQEVRAFAYLSGVSFLPAYAWGSGNGNAIGNFGNAAFLPDFPNRNLTWEKAITYNAGFDGSFFKNRLTATIEYYNRLTDGILQSASLPANVGNYNQPVFNIASVRNSGVEFQLGWNQTLGKDFSFGVSGNLTTVQNRVEKLFRDEPFGGEYGRVEIGKPLFYLWGFKTGGIYQTQQEADANNAKVEDKINGGFKSKPGDVYFQDVAGDPKESGANADPNPDGKINQYDRTYLGKTVPGYYYGFNFTLNWKGFDAGIFFQGVGDVQQVNSSKIILEGMSYPNLPNQSVRVKDRWTEGNPSTTIPRAVINDPNGNNRFSNRWVENAGFLRLRNLNVGYTLNSNQLKSMGAFAQSIRFWAMGSNLLTLTQWTGIDPEQTNRDGQIVPPTRAFTFGINVTF
jgi:TonB-dependent starch-binding outer membrane protein SusC